MVSGGYNGTGVLNSAETMNGNSVWATTAPMQTARMDHAAALVGSRYYVIGGRGTNFALLQSVEYYDGGTWTAGPTLPVPLYGSAAAVIGTKIYVMGGATTGLTVTNKVFVHDSAFPNSGWSVAPSLPVAVAYPAAIVVNGVIYLVGGDKGGSANPYAYIQKFTP
jgi:N-acetylneuraminic acid mutarotase